MHDLVRARAVFFGEHARAQAHQCFQRLKNVCAHDLLRARALFKEHTRARKLTNAFGKLENVWARTHTNAFV
jgi:hypothetical protein